MSSSGSHMEEKKADKERNGSTQAGSPGGRSKERIQGKLFVGALGEHIRKRDLEDEFSRFGRLSRCELKANFAFITFEDPDDALKAFHELRGKELLGCRLQIEWTKDSGRFHLNEARVQFCYNCKQTGHISQVCRKPAQGYDIPRRRRFRRLHRSRSRSRSRSRRRRRYRSRSRSPARGSHRDRRRERSRSYEWRRERSRGERRSRSRERGSGRPSYRDRDRPHYEEERRDRDRHYRR